MVTISTQHLLIDTISSMVEMIKKKQVNKKIAAIHHNDLHSSSKNTELLRISTLPGIIHRENSYSRSYLSKSINKTLPSIKSEV